MVAEVLSDLTNNSTTTVEDTRNVVYYVYAAPIISATLAPIAAVFAVSTVSVAFRSKRTIDVGVVFMVLSTGVNVWAARRQSAMQVISK